MTPKQLRELLATDERRGLQLVRVALLDAGGRISDAASRLGFSYPSYKRLRGNYPAVAALEEEVLRGMAHHKPGGGGGRSEFARRLHEARSVLLEDVAAAFCRHRLSSDAARELGVPLGTFDFYAAADQELRAAANRGKKLRKGEGNL